MTTYDETHHNEYDEDYDEDRQMAGAYGEYSPYNSRAYRIMRKVLMVLLGILTVLAVLTIWASTEYVNERNDSGDESGVRDFGVYLSCTVSGVLTLGLLGTGFVALSSDRQYFSFSAASLVGAGVFFLAASVQAARGQGNLDDREKVFVVCFFFVALTFAACGMIGFSLYNIVARYRQLENRGGALAVAKATAKANATSKAESNVTVSVNNNNIIPMNGMQGMMAGMMQNMMQQQPTQNQAEPALASIVPSQTDDLEEGSDENVVRDPDAAW